MARSAMKRFLGNSVAVGGSIVLLLLLAVAILAPLVSPHDPAKQDLFQMRKGPSPEHLLGTDQLGRDVLSRIIFGARISLAVSVGSVLLAALVGVPIGLTAGYFRSWWDQGVMRLMDVALSFPRVLLAILLVVALGSGLINLALAIGIWTIPVFARIMRSSAISVGRAEYVAGAKAIGASEFGILLRHVLPNCMGPLLVTASLSIATAILAESALSFLGLGVMPGTPTWGLMMAEGQEVMRIAPHLVLFPGLAIMLTVLAFNFVGDGLREALDPRSGKRI